MLSPAMISLQNLPNELIYEIASHLCIADQASLRATNTILRLCVEPLFCRNIYIPTNRLRWERTSEFFRALNAGSTGWSRYAKRLTIARATTPIPTCSAASAIIEESPVKGLLLAIHACARRITSIVFRISHDDPAWLYDTVCGTLPAFSVLASFELIQPDYVDLALPRLSGLVALKLSCATAHPKPKLYLTATLPLRILPMHPPATPSQDILNQVPAEDIICLSPNLRVLELVGIRDWDPVWDALLRSRIELKSVTINRLSAAAVAYLKSYSGLEALVVQPSCETSESTSTEKAAGMRELVAELKEAVLPRHKTTMKLLDLSSFDTL
ncbi:hypothetical protein MIND_00302900 [Mycena indigotica]|uniref:F-box domain-containing protein n=1 Tax=Mycena indigotica TaxID=2126181 RepID=A0A8H6T310_9AGAR|nr:uncharacterized protein MIND_00302900 [Mycena indigotica]KAF7309326.1 hypothetical protein MIND_00302900 [Mycena indigotica]